MFLYYFILWQTSHNVKPKFNAIGFGAAILSNGSKHILTKINKKHRKCIDKRWRCNDRFFFFYLAHWIGTFSNFITFCCFYEHFKSTFRLKSALLIRFGIHWKRKMPVDTKLICDMNVWYSGTMVVVSCKKQCVKTLNWAVNVEICADVWICVYFMSMFMCVCAWFII